MAQDDFNYRKTQNPGGFAATISIFSDRPYLRSEIAEDLRSLGFHCADGGEVEALLSGVEVPLGDVVLLDCPHIDAQRMAALAGLDMRLARSGAKLIITTSLPALDGVFAVFDQSDPQILVDATRADRIVAVGRVVGEVAGARVQDLSDEDRVVLLRLAEQVDAIARRLNRYDEEQGIDGVGSQLGDTKQGFKGFMPDYERREEGISSGDSLPDPQLVRRIIRCRQVRGKFFDADLFADPAWDMLLDLTAARAERKNVSVTSLCIASGVPATTALRWIRQMEKTGLFERVEDPQDKRRVFISLSELASRGMAHYFAEIGNMKTLVAV